MNATDVEGLLKKLVDIGLRESFSELSPIPKLKGQMHDLADRYRLQFRAFALTLSVSDRIALTKAVTIAEGPLASASPTNIGTLMELIPDPDRQLFAWVLEHCENGYYYGRGARSIEEYGCIQSRRRELSEARSKRESERQVADKRRTAEKATQNLFNAFLRGDQKAVNALVAKGADVNVLTIKYLLHDGSGEKTVLAISPLSDAAMFPRLRGEVIVQDRRYTVIGIGKDRLGATIVIVRTAPLGSTAIIDSNSGEAHHQARHLD